MNDSTFRQKEAQKAAQVALEFARQMGGTFKTDASRRAQYVNRSTQADGQASSTR